MLQIALENLLDNAWKFTGKTQKARIEFGNFERETRSLKPETRNTKLETVFCVKDSTERKVLRTEENKGAGE